MHKLRIEIKKINALVFFLRGCSKNENTSINFKPVNKLFKRAGHIRNSYVYAKLLDRYHLADSGLKTERRKIIVNRSRTFCSKYRKDIIGVKNTRTLLIRRIHGIANKEILRVYKNQLKKLHSLLTHEHSSRQLHKCRSKIKKLVYMYQVIHKPLANKLRLNIHYLDQLQNTIGKWHDTITAVELLRRQKNFDKTVVDKLRKRSQELSDLIDSASNNFGKKLLPVRLQNNPSHRIAHLI